MDIPYQNEKFRMKSVAKLGFKNYKVVNDSTLGIKVGTTLG